MSLLSDPLVSILIVNYNGGTVVLDCLRSLYTHLRSLPYEVIVVDNASQDGSPDAIAAQFPQVRLLRHPENVGFGQGNNIAATQARGEFLWLLNSDTRLTDDSLPALITQLKADPHIGILGPKLLNPDGSFQFSISESISILGEWRTQRLVRQSYEPQSRAELASTYNTLQAVAIVRGAAMVMRRALFEQMGGFDATFFMYFEESDLCQRVRLEGFQVIYMPTVSLIHLGSYSINQQPNRMALEYRRSQLYYYRKHRPLWEQLILRLYLGLKFAALLLQSRNRAYVPFLRLLMQYHPTLEPSPEPSTQVSSTKAEQDDIPLAKPSS